MSLIVSKTKEQIKEIIPQRDPFLMLDEVEQFIPGESCVAYKNVDEKRPFGYGQIESLYVVIKGIMMIAVSLGMCLSTIKLMLNGGNHVEINVILIAEIIYGFMNLFTLIILKRLSKNISSLSVDIQIKGWEVDVLYSFGRNVLAMSLSISNTSSALQTLGRLVLALVMMESAIF